MGRLHAPLPTGRFAVVSAGRLRKRLELQEFEEARSAHLAADTRLLVAAERRIGRVTAPAVHAHGSRADATRDRQRALPVGAQDAPGDAEDRVVGDAGRVLVTVV